MNIPTKASSNWLSGFREKHYKLRKPFGQHCGVKTALVMNTSIVIELWLW